MNVVNTINGERTFSLIPVSFNIYFISKHLIKFHFCNCVDEPSSSS